jgi:hypothetical protein
MGWTTPQITQNGNTEVGWIISGGALTNHDVIVTQLLFVSLPSLRIRITRLEQRITPNEYHVWVRVVGPGPVAYRFAGQAIA